MKPALLLSCIVLFFGLSAKGQSSADTTSNRTTIFGLPIVYYTPETRWAFGAAGFLSWRFPAEADSSRPSQIQLGGAYTLNDQILSYLSYQLWWDKERCTLLGELGWYRYNYYYFGTGNTNPPDTKELYGVNYPRLRVTLQYAFIPHLYAGVRLTADDFRITELAPDGLLINGDVPGIEGGVNSGAGLALTFDTRDKSFDAHSGWYAELNIDRHGRFLNSDYTYTHFIFDLRKYIPIHPKNFLALNLYTELISGRSPFITLALLGGNKRMRGLYEGRYRDNTSAIVQAEYRRQIVGRLGAVAFGALGGVSTGYGDMQLQYVRKTYGAGLRFAVNKKDRINIRFDVGVGNGEPAYYLTIGEAF